MHSVSRALCCVSSAVHRRAGMVTNRHARYGPASAAHRKSAALRPGTLPRRHDGALDFAEADAKTVALAPAAHQKRIAVLQKRPLLAARQIDRLGAVPADLQ